MSDFPGFFERVEPFLSGAVGTGDAVELKRLLCSDCEFFTPGEDEELECGCFHILIRLLERGVVTLEQVADALR